MEQSQISDLRASIDGLSKTVVILGVTELAINTSHCKHHLIRAKRWLGKVNEARNYDSPYRGNYANVAEIVPETDVVKDVEPVAADLLQRLQEHRGVVGVLIDQVKDQAGSSRLESIAWTQVYVSLCDAKMALGEAIGALRDAATTK